MHNNNTEFLNSIYKTARTGVESIHAVLSKTSDQKLASDLTQQMDKYQDFALAASNRMKEYHVKPQDNNLMTKISINTGIQANTFLDDSPSHIAEMMINGSTMGVIQMTKDLNKFTDCDESLKRLGSEMLAFEQQNIEHLKGYLH